MEYPDRTFSAICKHIDDYHANISGEVYHICRFAEILERGGGSCHPEPEMNAEQMAWKVGRSRSLAVELRAGKWQYHLYDAQYSEIKSGTLRADGSPINEMRNSIIAENRLGYCSLRMSDYGALKKEVAARRRETRTQKRESVLSQLAPLQAEAKGSAAPAPTKNRSTNSR